MTQSYTATAKAFHWLTVLAVGGLFGLGWFMTDLDLSPQKLQLYSWHKWLGITVLLLTSMRLLWRWRHPAPPLDVILPPWQRFMAHAGHAGLYGLLIAMPLVGWVRSSAAGFPVVLYGIIPLPEPSGPNNGLADLLETVHWAGSVLLGVMILGHVGAAIWHHAVKKDTTLRRMLPGAVPAMALIVAAGLGADAGDVRAGAADPWTIDPAQSTLTFTAKQVGVPVEGRFGDFTSTVVFDPATPGDASVRLEIVTASAATGQKDADQALASRDFFNVAEHPIAIFEANGFSSANDNAYRIDGTLTLKGTTLPVAMDATIDVTEDGNGGLTATATGSVTISRLAFKIGEGQWGSTKAIADDVVITVSLAASRNR